MSAFFAQFPIQRNKFIPEETPRTPPILPFHISHLSQQYFSSTDHLSLSHSKRHLLVILTKQNKRLWIPDSHESKFKIEKKILLTHFIYYLKEHYDYNKKLHLKLITLVGFLPKYIYIYIYPSHHTTCLFFCSSISFLIFTWC